MNVRDIFARQIDRPINGVIRADQDDAETLISRNGEDFFFLTNEERDVSRDIKNVDLNAGDTSRLMGELIFSEVLKDQYKHTYSVNGKTFNL